MGTTAIVAGASGLVGRELTSLLLVDSFYDRVVVLVRKKMNLKHEKMIQIVTDYSNLNDVLDPSFIEHSHVFCALGTTIKKAKTKEQFRKVDFEYPMALGELAKNYEADTLAIVTAMGASRSSSFFYSQVKGEVEEGLSALGLRSLSILRPSLILGDREEIRSGERMWAAISRALTPLMIGGLRTYRPIQAKTIAVGMIKAAKTGATGVRVLSSGQIADLASD